MQKDNRKHPRQAVSLDIELSYPPDKVIVVKTQDVSIGGAFLIIGEQSSPKIGEVVSVKILDSQSSEITFPSSDAVVVRQEKTGIGLAFIEMDLVD